MLVYYKLPEERESKIVRFYTLFCAYVFSKRITANKKPKMVLLSVIKRFMLYIGVHFYDA